MPLNTNQQGYSNVDAPYSNQAFNSNAWLEKEQSRSRRSKFLVSPPCARPSVSGGLVVDPDVRR